MINNVLVVLVVTETAPAGGHTVRPQSRHARYARYAARRCLCDGHSHAHAERDACVLSVAPGALAVGSSTRRRTARWATQASCAAACACRHRSV